jgi:hypothetical protein
VAAAGEGAAGEEAQDLNAALLEQIEAQFVAARAPLVHWKDPTLRPVEVLPGGALNRPLRVAAGQQPWRRSNTRACCTIGLPLLLAAAASQLPAWRLSSLFSPFCIALTCLTGW